MTRAKFIQTLAAILALVLVVGGVSFAVASEVGTQTRDHVGHGVGDGDAEWREGDRHADADERAHDGALHPDEPTGSVGGADAEGVGVPRSIGTAWHPARSSGRLAL